MFDLNTIVAMNAKAETQEMIKDMSGYKISADQKAIDDLKCQAQRMSEIEYLRETYPSIHNSRVVAAKKNAATVVNAIWHSKSVRRIAARV